MATKVESRGGTRPTKVTFNRSSNPTSTTNAGIMNEANHDVHVKMSKKIAQLTKVIFSLNTKNDEHEEIIDALKTAHQLELQKVMIESKEKIGHYKQKMDLVKEQESLINRLQNLLEDERKEKQNFIDEFENFKHQRRKNESEMTAKQEERLKDFSSKLTRLKDEYENRTQQFELVRRDFETEKEKMLSDLSHKHSLEMDKLIKAHRVRYDELENNNQKLQENLEKLQSDKVSNISQKDSEIENLVKEHETKCNKLKSFYENELLAIKRKHESSLTEVTENIKKEEQLTQRALKRTEEELRNRIEKLTKNNEELEADLLELRKSLKNSKSELDKSLTDNNYHTEEASRLKQNLGVAEVRLKSLEDELDSLKERYSLQTQEVVNMSAQLGSFEALKISTDNVIEELNMEVKRLVAQCNDLETEKTKLGTKLTSENSESESQIKALQRDLERLNGEKNSAVAKYEQMLTEVKEKHDGNLQNIILSKEEQISNLNNKYTSELENQRIMFEKELHDFQQSFSASKSQEISTIQTATDQMLLQKADEIERLQELYNKSTEEIDRLNNLLNVHKSNQITTSSEVKLLEGKLEDLKKALKQAQDKFVAAKNEVKTLQDSLVLKEKGHNAKLQLASKESDERMKDMAKELDNQWAQKLRDECEKLRVDLKNKQREENHATVSQITAIKDKEIEAYKSELQQQISKYQLQIKELRSTIQSLKIETQNIMKRNAEELSSKRIQHEEEIAKQRFDHTGQLERLYLENERSLKEISERHNQDLKNLETKLQTEHQESIAAIMLANRSAVDAMRTAAEKAKEEEMEKLSVAHSEEKDALRHTLHVQHQDNIEQISLEFEEEINLIKQELQKMKDLRSKEFEIHAAKIEELNSKLTLKDTQVDQLEEELETVKENIKTLNHELESKVEDIRKVRREANLNLRRREQQLAKEHQNEVDGMTAEHLRETQKLLSEFNRAKELLKDKVDALQILLEQAEERYRNRESRLEDLEKIEQLKVLARDRELECNKMLEEKRYFQMELLNRETNFNKIFNNMPTVGLINPLDTVNKKRKSSKERWNLAGTRPAQGQSNGTTSPARLDPLPHPQLHEQRLNNSKPLPRAPVKGT